MILKIPFLFPRSKMNSICIFVQATNLSHEYFAGSFPIFVSTYILIGYMNRWFNLS